MKKIMCLLIFISVLPSQLMAEALEVKITKEKEYAVVKHGNDKIKIQRIQDTSHLIEGSFAKTSRACPPFCIAPIMVAPGVTTVAELEVIEFMESKLSSGQGFVIDARTPSWHGRGTIPGSINIPFTKFDGKTESSEVISILERFGSVMRNDVSSIERMLEQYVLPGSQLKTDNWDFTNAKDVLFWCNGPWCGQSPRAIKALLKHGYPAEKVFYYRGGMQMWQSLGLTTVAPASSSAPVTDPAASAE